MKSVEIIPWTHAPYVRAFEEVLEFIRTIPKNSTIGLEVSPVDLANPEKIQTDNPNGKASLQETIMELETRNIKVIPLENHQLLMIGRSKRNAILEERRKFGAKRDAIAVSKVENALKHVKGEKLILIVGLGHAPVLQSLLRQKGIETKIETSIFGDLTRPILKNALRVFAEQAEAISKRNHQAAEMAQEELSYISAQILRIRRKNMPTNGHITQADLELAKKALEERKTKLNENKLARIKRKQANCCREKYIVKCRQSSRSINFQ